MHDVAPLFIHGLDDIRAMRHAGLSAVTAVYLAAPGLPLLIYTLGAARLSAGRFVLGKLLREMFPDPVLMPAVAAVEMVAATGIGAQIVTTSAMLCSPATSNGDPEQRTVIRPVFTGDSLVAIRVDVHRMDGSEYFAPPRPALVDPRLVLVEVRLAARDAAARAVRPIVLELADRRDRAALAPLGRPVLPPLPRPA